MLGSYILMVLFNFLAMRKGFGGKDNKEISDSHPTYLSPDGATFAIWGIIYTLETVMVIAQLFSAADEVFSQHCPITGLSVRMCIVCAFLANSLWLPLFNNEYFWSGLLIMSVYLGFLLSVYQQMNTGTIEGGFERVAYAAGLTMNTSWIVVAFLLSVFFCGGLLGWNDAKDDAKVAGSVPAAMLGVLLVAAIGCERAIRACDLSWAFVAAWALRGIWRMQTVPDKVRFPITMMNDTLGNTAWFASCAVGMSMLIGVANAVYHRSDAKQV